jgi:DNA-binding CsgD family transcriptional regulator
MKIPIQTNKKKFYRQVLEVLRSLPPLDTLRSRELSLLSMIMYYNDLYKSVDENIRWRIINDTMTRKEIQKELNMNEYLFSNNLSIIKKAGVISKDGALVKFLQISPENNKFGITFTFNISEDNG